MIFSNPYGHLNTVEGIDFLSRKKIYLQENETEVTTQGKEIITFDVSKDKEKVAMWVTSRAEKGALFLIDARNETKKEIFSADDYQGFNRSRYFTCSFSSNSKKVIFSYPIQTKDFRPAIFKICILDIPSGKITEVTQGRSGKFSPTNLNQIAYTDNNALFIFNLKTKEKTKIAEDVAIQDFAWSPTGSQLAYINNWRDIYIVRGEFSSKEKILNITFSRSFYFIEWGPTEDYLLVSELRTGGPLGDVVKYFLVLIKIDSGEKMDIMKMENLPQRPFVYSQGKIDDYLKFKSWKLIQN